MQCLEGHENLFLRGHASSVLRTFIFSSATFAEQNGILIAGRTVKQITTIRAKNQRSNCRHFDYFAAVQSSLDEASTFFLVQETSQASKPRG